ncbi:MAG: transporter substrate-binding protein [Candidatus Nitronauta litoralis]|uniref:Transporter substrate-binding protein n=1 Tax=Candidatus Nitronauta litoralis TaxID=2705533 RepID=A0A7T0BZ86_9BACT|nr:MAG: transporter substrate-binding protein [Candidatus Nitronauta litoralis]
MPLLAHYSKSLSQYKYYFSGKISISLLFISVSCTELGKDSAPIKVGLLFSRTGTMAFSEEPVLEATLIALEESGNILYTGSVPNQQII